MANFLSSLYVVLVIPTSPDEAFATDACLSGCGGLSSTEYFHSVFPRNILTICTTIHHLELLTMSVNVCSWGRLWQGHRMQLLCNNEAVVSVINTGRTRDMVLATCLQEIWLRSAQGKLELCAIHLSSYANNFVLQTICPVGMSQAVIKLNLVEIKLSPVLHRCIFPMLYLSLMTRFNCYFAV